MRMFGSHSPHAAAKDRAASVGRTDRRFAGITFAAPSLRCVDLSFMAEWTDGALALAGHSVATGNRSPFEMTEAPIAWRWSLFGFGWLRHLPRDADARGDVPDRLEPCLQQWLAHTASQRDQALLAETAPRRLLSWLAHADVVFSTRDPALYDRLERSLANDVGRVVRVAQSNAPLPTKMLARAAHLLALLAQEGSHAEMQAAERDFADLWQRAKISAQMALVASPDDLTDLVLDVEALRRAYLMFAAAAPPALTDCAGHLRALLGTLVLGDGRIARLGTPRFTTESQADLATVLRGAGRATIPAIDAAVAGVARLGQATTCLVVGTKVGLTNPSALEVEMSSGNAALFVHDGLTSEERSGGDGVIIGVGRADVKPADARIAPASEAQVRSDDPACLTLDATHHGLAPRGVVHRRRLVLCDDGATVLGHDELRPLVGHAAPAPESFGLRFVLDPAVRVSAAGATGALMLSLANGHRWRLVAEGRDVSVERALYRDGCRRLETLQVAVLPADQRGRSIDWSLRRHSERN